jgi:hypothetical protein
MLFADTVWFAQDTPISLLATLSTVRPHLLFIAGNSHYHKYYTQKQKPLSQCSCLWHLIRNRTNTTSETFDLFHLAHILEDHLHRSTILQSISPLPHLSEAPNFIPNRSNIQKSPYYTNFIIQSLHPFSIPLINSLYYLLTIVK